MKRGSDLGTKAIYFGNIFFRGASRKHHKSLRKPVEHVAFSLTGFFSKTQLSLVLIIKSALTSRTILSQSLTVIKMAVLLPR